MRHVICPNESCRAACYIEDALWAEMTAPGSMVMTACSRCDTRIPGPHLENAKHRLQNGFWSMGNGGCVIKHNEHGLAYPEQVIPDDPARIISPLPFLLVRAEWVSTDGYLPPARYAELPIELYTDCRDETLGGVDYKAWYKKRIPPTTQETVQLELNQFEIREILRAAKKMYGDDRYAAISEVVLYDFRQQFVHRANMSGPMNVGSLSGITIDIQ